MEEQHLQNENFSRTEKESRVESPPSPNSKSLEADLIVCACISVVLYHKMQTCFVCADIYACACIIGLRMIYVGAFAFELRIFLERRHFE